MEDDRRKMYTIVAAVAAVALVLSCFVAAVVGGLAGMLLAREQARSVAERVLEQESDNWRGLPAATPAPEELPFLTPEPGWQMLPGMAGAIVVEVVPGSPAEEAGLKVGDIITAVDDAPLDRNHALADLIALYKPGDRVTVGFWRAGQEDTVEVKLGENPDQPGKAYLGVHFREMMGWPERQATPGWQG